MIEGSRRLLLPFLIGVLSGPALLTSTSVLCAAPVSQHSAKQEKARVKEESEDYFKRWLDQDVVYIITDDERDVFNQLTTPEEKDAFIEEFWRRRDPDPRTAINEFKEEHFRRIAYANQWFTSGKPGWMTDRGRIYIIHGPPNEIESYPTGGPYYRPVWEGGGSTSTYPFEIWRYRHIDGVGDDVELEFVDAVGGGEYKLALDPDEKDQLLHVPGLGLTWNEQRGLSSKEYRLPPSFNTLREKDNPFRRYETYARVQGAPAIKHGELRQLIDVNVEYATLPLEVRQDQFRLSDSQILVPVTVEIPNRELTFKPESGIQVARVTVYGIVKDLSGRIASEFDDDLVTAYTSERLPAGREAASIYQKILPLADRGRYRVDIVVKDLGSEKVGVAHTAIVAAGYPEERLTASSVILSNQIRQLAEAPEQNEMFVLGDMKILPSLHNRFPAGGPVSAYLQIYDAALDQTTLQPDLEVRYRILKDGRTVVELMREGDSAVFSFSNRRLILIKSLPVRALEPGRYDLRITVRDRIGNQEVETGTAFEILSAERTDHTN
jgi:GWxTD domain-containing protein